MSYQLYQEDCLLGMASLEEGSIDAVITDLPYGITQADGDICIPFDPMWISVSRILKESGVFITTASQPFSSMLVCSNLDWFRHEWVWRKNRGSNFANTVREPMKDHETVLVFSKGHGWTYNPQLEPRKGGGITRVEYPVRFKTSSENYRVYDEKPPQILPQLRVPSSVQEHVTEVGLHPQQKPLDLYIYLVETYTNPGDKVLDCAMGSGTTGVACMHTNRDFYGYEIQHRHFLTAQWRIKNAAGDFALSEKEKESGQLSLF